MSSHAHRVVLALPPGIAPTDGPGTLSASLVRRGNETIALASRTGDVAVQVQSRNGSIIAARIDLKGSSLSIDHVRRAADRLAFTSLTSLGSSTTRFDRQERVFGRSGQQTLSALHIGVVGAGGTGSAVVELLSRLGVGRLTVIDDDAVSETNLTRIHQSTSADVGTAKCELAGRLARELDTMYRGVAGRVTERTTARELATCDVIFGCTDDHAGRIVLARMAPRYLQLLVDVGVTVDVVDGRVVGAPCRISVQAPGDTCIVCRGHVDLAAASAELLSEKDRTSRAREGYVPGLAEPDPSVVTYTTLAASTAVSEMLARLFGFGCPEAVDLLVDPVAGRWSRLNRLAEDVDRCTSPETLGSGEQEPFLGMSW